MIRPFTFVCMLLAGASGLYLYQSKHRAQMLDRDIADKVKQADTIKERTGMLRAEWALQNDPDRLKDLVRAHAPSLHPLAPAQFVAMADLASRLPAPVAPGTQVAAPETDEPPATAPAASEPAPAPAPTIAQAAPPPVAKPAPVHVAVAAAPPPEPKPAEPKPIQTARHVPPHPVELASAPAPAYRSIQQPMLPPGVNSAAVAPGTVGAAVLRAMRANAGYSYAASTPTQAYAAPASLQPAYAPAPATSLLGAARAGALPPPTPYAFR